MCFSLLMNGRTDASGDIWKGPNCRCLHCSVPGRNKIEAQIKNPVFGDLFSDHRRAILEDVLKEGGDTRSPFSWEL